MEQLPISPTAYEIERQKQQRPSAKRLLAEGRRQVKIATNSYAIALSRGTTGHQYAALLLIRRVSEMYGIELDPLFRWLIALHEAVQIERQTDHPR